MRGMSLQRVVVVLVTCITAACGGASGSTLTPAAPSGSTTAQTSAVATAHLNNIVDIMQAQWYFRATTNWTTFRASVLAVASGAQTIEDTYPAIKTALTMLGDQHSYYITTGGEFIFNPQSPSAFGVCASNPEPPEPPRYADIGYIRVRIYLNGDMQARAKAIQDAIRAEERSGLIGWIVDMRNSHGGNMWPALAGLGSLLGEGIAGYFVPPGTLPRVSWSYKSGGAYNDSDVFVQLPAAPVALRVSSPKIAVLTDTGVSSSGEAIAISFRERPNTRSFGAATCGLSTVVSQATLQNGAVLGIVFGKMADRTGRQYGGIVVPDEPIADVNAAFLRAVAWLRGQ